MEYLKIKWKAKDKGSIKVPFEDLGLSIEEWDSFTDEEREQMINDIICSSDDTIAYGYPTSYSVIEIDD